MHRKSQGRLQVWVCLIRRNSSSEVHAHPSDQWCWANTMTQEASAFVLPDKLPSDLLPVIVSNTDISASGLGTDVIKRETETWKSEWTHSFFLLSMSIPSRRRGEQMTHAKLQLTSATSIANTAKSKAVFPRHWPLQASVKNDGMPKFKNSVWPNYIINCTEN